jgi:hypothetical protein
MTERNERVLTARLRNFYRVNFSFDIVRVVKFVGQARRLPNQFNPGGGNACPTSDEARVISKGGTPATLTTCIMSEVPERDSPERR